MIPLFSVNISDDVDDEIIKTLHSGYLSQGPRVEEFERLLEDYFYTSGVLTFNSCTSAITLALRLLDLKPGDEIITTPMTCSATNVPILSFGATPVFADIDSESGLIMPIFVADLLNEHTRAIMAVDWGGAPVNVQQLNKIAEYGQKRYGHRIAVIVDAAHAFATKHNAIPDFTCYSLQAIKHMTTADGGILICKYLKDYSRAKRLRWFGIDREKGGLDSRINEDILEWGYKFHMNDLNATIGIQAMKIIDKVFNRHCVIAKRYDKRISSFYGKPKPNEGSYWLYTLRLPSEYLRDEFKKYMTDKGIMVSQIHRRNDDYTVFSPYKQFVSAGVDFFSSVICCIPINFGLKTADINKIIDCCNRFAELHS